MGYLNQHQKMGIMFDSRYTKVSGKCFKEYNRFDFYRYAKEALSPNMSESRGHNVIVMCFVDINCTSNLKYVRSQTDILIFINRSLIHCYRKWEPKV